MVQVVSPPKRNWGRHILAWAWIAFVFIAIMSTALQSIDYHWIGVKLDNYLKVILIVPKGPADEAGIRVGDKIVAVKDRPAYSRNHFLFLRRINRAGEPYAVTVHRADGATSTLTIVGRRDENVAATLILSLIGFAFLSIGSVVYLFQIRDKASRIFFVATTTLALSYGMVYTCNPYLGLLQNAGFLAAALIVQFFLAFPVYRPWASRPWVHVLLHLPGCVLFALSILTSTGILGLDLFDARSLVSIYQVIGAAIGFVILVYTAFTSKHPLVRQQTKWIIWGLAIAVLFNGIYQIYRLIPDLPELLDLNLVNWITMIVPISFAFSIVRYRLFDIDTVINRSIVYVIVTLAILIVYFVSVRLMGTLDISVRYDNPVVIALLIILVSVMLDPLRQQAQIVADRVMYHRRPDYRQVMQEVSREVVSSIDLDHLLKMFIEHLYRVTRSERIQIFLYNSRENRYCRAATLGPSGSTAPFPADHPLIKAMHLQDQFLRMPDMSEHSSSAPQPSGIEEFMQRESLVLCLPLRVHSQLLGWLGFGIQYKGKLYSLDERRFLITLADQAAVAIQNALLYQESLERSQRWSTLYDIARVLTSTLDMSDLLRRFLAELVRAFSVETASVMLKDQEQNSLVFKAAVGSGDDILPGVSIALNSRSIAALVADTGTPVLSNGIQSDSRWYSAIDQLTHFTTRQLICVPIWQRDEIIGAIEIVNRKDKMPFTDIDLNMLTLLAAQAAMAIENAQLYALTDHALAERVHELSIMQEIDRQLNATLDFDRVLRMTLEWAASATQADAGFIGMIKGAKQNEISISVAQGYPTLQQPRERPTCPLGQGLISQVIAHAQVINDSNVASDEKDIPRRSSARSRLIVPVMREEKVIGVINLESDKSNRFETQDETFVARLADHAAIAIENANLYQEVMRVNESKSEFVSNVAHELKAPMTIIKGFAELFQLNLKDLDPEQQKLLEAITSNVERMRRLINDLLQLSHLESGKIELDRLPVSINASVAEVIAAFRPATQDSGISVSLDLQPDTPFVYADEMRLNQILTNLIGNAVKYTPRGKSITIKTERHLEEGGNGKEFVRCTVCDTGIGMSEEDQRQLFNRFFRANHPYARRQAGTGLGLSITKRLIELHEGQIGAQSRLGEGSAFWFDLPIVG